MKKKILIVEDEFVVANDLEIMLNAAGYEIVGIAISAKAALEAIDRDHPDLVLLDIMLQGAGTGIDLARKLKTLHIAFVYISANSNQTTLQEATATQPYGFLVKPIRPKDLLATLGIACYRHEHSIEAFLSRKKRFLQELAVLVRDGVPTSGLLPRIAGMLQVVIPFDLLCFTGAATGFRALYRTGFNEYQEIDETGLGIIAGKTATEMSTLLSDHDRLAALLHQLYDLQSVARGGNLSVWSKDANRYYDRHLSALEEMQKPMESLLAHQHYGGVATGDKKNGNGSQLLAERFIGKSNAILRCLDLVAQVAPLDTSVLITGESGTGKELFAEAIHQLSPRNRESIVKINCAALPYTLIESELFGYEKGAFTGAVAARIGVFEAAAGGTIFLDEIGELPLEVQAKLLRVLQEKEVQRLGGHKVIHTDVRIIAATNRNLEKAVAEHRFRLDLYFRLNVFPIHLPPLRRRKEDIPLLANHLGRQIAQKMARPFCGISEDMMGSLIQYDWPGNVRELENVLERAFIVSGPQRPMSLEQPLAGLAVPDDGAVPMQKINTIEEIRQQQERLERDLIEAVLRETRGRIRGRGGAAERLDIKPTTLESRLARFGMRREDFK